MMNSRIALTTLILLFILSADLIAQWVSANGQGGNTIFTFATSSAQVFSGTSGGIVRSTDAGISWTEVNNGIPTGNVYALTTAGNVVLAGSDFGVMISTNNGVNWLSANNGLTDHGVRALCAGGDRLLAGTYGGRIFRSTDIGSEWTIMSGSVLPAPITALLAMPSGVAPNSFLSGTYGGGIFMSTNNGSDWFAINNGLTNPFVNSLAVFDNGTSNYLFAATDGGGVFISTNNGTSWIAVNNGLTNHIVWALATIPSGAGGVELFAGTSYSQGLFLSTDLGASWGLVNNGLGGAGVTSLGVSPFSPSDSTLFAGSAGIFRSTNNGTDWVNVNQVLTSQVIPALAFPQHHLLAGTINRGVLLSRNAGSNWVFSAAGLPSGAGVICFAVSVAGASDTNVFVGTTRGAFRSIDKGVSWQAVGSGMTDSVVNAFAVGPNGANGTSVFAGSRQGRIFLSTDQGQNWSAAHIGLTSADVRTLLATLDGTGYSNLFAGTFGAGVFRSTDNGASWVSAGTGLTDTFVLSLVANYSGTGGVDLFAGTTRGVSRSTNFGASWTGVNAGLPQNVTVTSLAASPYGSGGEDVFAGTIGSYVYHSSNNGENWFSVQTGLTGSSVYALAASDTFLFAGTYTSGVWRRPLSEMITSVQATSTDLPTQFYLVQNYPNPFNPSTQIKFDLPEASTVSLVIYDVLGRQVAELATGYHEAGHNSVTWNTSNEASGIYFALFNVTDAQGNVKYSKVNKLVLMK